MCLGSNISIDSWRHGGDGDMGVSLSGLLPPRGVEKRLNTFKKRISTFSK
jgi:hypothetical protein